MLGSVLIDIPKDIQLEKISYEEYQRLLKKMNELSKKDLLKLDNLTVMNKKLGDIIKEYKSRYRYG